ncbi:MAG: phosphoglycerate mutase, partial [Alphaproteobacteria bacterium]|nr:phosphoglycerate mutase [Alphaproteobacteria bacterium]
ENKTEEDVIARIGAPAIAAWNDRTIVPEGWIVDLEAIIANWAHFGKQCDNDYKGKTILAITSNGIARFAPHLTESFKVFAKIQDIKISTGALCILEKSDTDTFWKIKSWNIRP